MTTCRKILEHLDILRLLKSSHNKTCHDPQFMADLGRAISKGVRVDRGTKSNKGANLDVRHAIPRLHDSSSGQKKEAATA